MMSNKEAAYDGIEDDSMKINKDNELGVINYTCLINLLTPQSPKGEAERLYLEDGINLDEVEEIRIEFLRILKIDHLWIMTNLVKLSLSHNAIEKIEKLEALTKLRELDISFNSIEIMENLNCLLNLEILLLAGNQISRIENIDNLKNLTIFSVANNKIHGWEHVLYLRQFKNLKSMNIAGNPCTLEDNYRNYFIAFLPQILYFSYIMIQEEDRNEAMKIHWKSIAKIEEDEARAEALIEKERALREKIAIDSNAFVDRLDEDEFFQLLFEHDTEGITLKDINEETLVVFEKYKTNFSNICHELHEIGMEQYSKRREEIEMFSAVVKKAGDDVSDDARSKVNSIEEKQDVEFRKFSTEMNELNKKLDEEFKTNDQSNLRMTEKLMKIQTFTKEFHQFLSTIWTRLMYNEVLVHEQIEDINETFKLNMTDMRDIFVDSVRVSFSQMRSIMIEYRDTINKVVSSYLNTIVKDELPIPAHLIDICGDANILNNTLASSHDIHIQQNIDGREDDTIRRINEWFEDLVEKLRKEENSRHRQRVLEISHILQYHRESLRKYILATDNLAMDALTILEE